MARIFSIKADREDHTQFLTYALRNFHTHSPELEITIVAKDGQLDVNRLLLCMYSPTISSALSSSSSTSSILLLDFSVASVWILIDLLIFGFSSLVDISGEWFQNVLDIANILNIQINDQNVQFIHREILEQIASQKEHSDESEIQVNDYLEIQVNDGKIPEGSTINQDKNIYEVTCKNCKGEFHHDKFISGGKGQCVLFMGTWMTPNNFEKIAGSKGRKYKESLKVNGIPIKNLIDPHSTGLLIPSLKQNLPDILARGEGESNDFEIDELNNPSRMTAPSGHQKQSTNLNRYYDHLKTTGIGQVSYATKLTTLTVQRKQSPNPSVHDDQITTTTGADKLSLHLYQRKKSAVLNNHDDQINDILTEELSNATKLSSPKVIVKRKESSNMNNRDDELKAEEFSVQNENAIGDEDVKVQMEFDDVDSKPNALGDEELTDDINLSDDDSIKVTVDGVYEITCKQSRAEFHHHKFISGGKGECIFFKEKWMTPSDFEKLAGSRGKKYKETLRLNGKPLKTLLDPRRTRLASRPIKQMLFPGLNDVAKRTLIVSPKLPKVPESDEIQAHNSNHLTPSLKKLEYLLDKDYKRNAVSDSRESERVNVDMKRKRQSNNSNSAKNSNIKIIKLESPKISMDNDDFTNQESDLYDAPDSLLQSTKLEMKTKVKLNECSDDTTENIGNNTDEKNELLFLREICEKNPCKCNCGLTFKKTLLLKLHKSEDCVHLTAQRDGDLK